jgi:hypothetical protein
MQILYNSLPEIFDDYFFTDLHPLVGADEVSEYLSLLFVIKVMV